LAVGGKFIKEKGINYSAKPSRLRGGSQRRNVFSFLLRGQKRKDLGSDIMPKTWRGKQKQLIENNIMLP
jgi:hypothetical protein